MPKIQGTTLIIEGKIDSHIYGFLSYSSSELRNIRTVQLNSYGGNIQWALEIARVLRSMKVTTQITSESVCASSCVVVFGAGQNRIMSARNWIGIHGIRGGDGFIASFHKNCFFAGQYDETSNSCRESLSTWKNAASAATQQFFTFLEQGGVSSLLRFDYISKPDEKDWVENLNILRKPDWVLSSTEARKYQLATLIR